MRMRSWPVPAFVILLCAAVTLAPAPPIAAGPDPVGAYFDSVRHEPDRLEAFLRDMPKGGDLHMHLSGATSTETLLRFAVEDGLCIDTATSEAISAPCRAGQRPAADTDGDHGFRDTVIAAWSMKGFVPGPESGHDHFFATFDKFGRAGDGRYGQMLAEVAARAAGQHEYYIEPLVTPGFAAVEALAKRVGYDPDFAAMRSRMTADGAMDRIVAQVSREVDAAFNQMRATLRCNDRNEADAGCDLPVRLDYQVLRAFPPEVVFAQMLLGFELMAKERRFVGVNLVQPEDDPVARRDYRLHMVMLDFLRGRYPRGHITLHAGELTGALAPPEDLRFHIHNAVVTGHAERIGHGVDIAGEEGAGETLRTMAQRHVLVEIALTSNDQILGVKGNQHPFALYRHSGVPVALVTDDEGVSRTDLTAQYQRAVTTYDLGYGDLKTMARAALQHGFLQGEDLWQGPDDFRVVRACARDRPGRAEPRSSTCRALLRSSAKARAEWDQETGFGRFERRYGGGG
jgi:adenosine deaminase